MARRVAKKGHEDLSKLWNNPSNFKQVFKQAFRKEKRITNRLKVITLVGAFTICAVFFIPAFLILMCKSTPQTQVISTSVEVNVTKPSINITPKDREILARIVNSEAGNQSDEGQRAVAQVIINRTKSPKYPSTIGGVVWQKNQFHGAGNSRYYSKIPQRVYDNVDFILDGNRQLPDNVFNFKTVTCDARWNLKHYKQIGDHNFYYDVSM